MVTVNPHPALRQVVATFLGLDPDQVTSDLSLAGPRIQGSLAKTRLAAAIRRQLGVNGKAIYSARTFGELQAGIYGATESGSILHLSTSNHGPNPLESPTLETPTHLSCGVDIEMVADLPVVKDYWEDSFYSTTFTASEIAYCLMQSNPSMHFAARWCAKEALKKCDPAYEAMDLNHLEVALTTTGAPFLRFIANGTAEPLPVAVSLSHTPHIALAAVVKSSPPKVSNITPAAHAPTSTLALEANTHREISSSAPTFLSALALIVALWALAYSW
jgi:phosphopantetheine--protein transferase-like protein